MSLRGATLAVGRRIQPRRAPHLLPAATYVLPVVAYAAISIVLFSRFLNHLGHAVPGGPDGIIYVWYFEWVEQAFIHGHNVFIAPGLNAPHGVSIMWNTSMLLVAVLAIPLTATVGPFAAVVIVAVIAPVASATTTYLVLRRLSGSMWGGILGGLLFGFGPFFVGQNGHIHLSLAVFAPVLLLLGHELIVTQQRNPIRTGIWLGIALALGLLATQEVVAITVLMAGIAVVILALTAPRQVRPRLPHVVIGLAVAGGVALVIDCVPLYYQFFGPLRLRGVPAGIPLQTQDLAGLVRPSGLQYFASKSDVAANHTFPANAIENTGYLGWPLILLCLGLVVWLIVRRDRFAYWWLATTAIAILLSLGTPVSVNGHEEGRGPWAVFDKLPLFKGVVPVRFSLVVTLLVAFLIAFAIGRLSGRWRVAVIALAALALVPLVPAERYGEDATSAAPRFFTTSSVTMIKPGSNVVMVPTGNRPFNQTQLMTWQIRAHLRFNLIGGYSVFKVNGQMSYLVPPNNLQRALGVAETSSQPPSALFITEARDAIARDRVRYVLISVTEPNWAHVARSAAALTGCAPRRIDDVIVCAIPG